MDRNADEITFAELGLDDALVATLDRLGYEEPTPIQRATIPVLLEGVDLVGQAATGTGKTAAFTLPILQRLGSRRRADSPAALIIAPTRELAVQVADAVDSYSEGRNISVVPVFGGEPIGRQIGALRRGADVVVGTPGRAVDHVKRGSLDLSAIEVVVLDEADEMLDMGFADDLDALLSATPPERQTVLFSATMPPHVKKIADSHQRSPVTIDVGGSPSTGEDATIREVVHFVHRRDKLGALARILAVEAPGAALVFCRTRHEVDELTVAMVGKGLRAEPLHGGMDQAQRDRVMGRLRDGSADLLVATDVAARGLDVSGLTHVVNYDVPSAPESYVHRIGRVGRAGREGTAVTLAEPRERRLLGNIERLVGHSLPVEPVPSATMRRRRENERVADAVRAALARDDLERHRTVLDQLDDEGPERVALALLALLDDAAGVVDDEREYGDPRKDDKRTKGRPDRDRGRGRGNDRGRGKGGRPSGPTGFVYVGIGRKGGVRPADLVGAIANESGLTGAQIGPIRISDGHSVVGVPEDQVERVVKSMRKASVRGKDVTVRRFVE